MGITNALAVTVIHLIITSLKYNEILNRIIGLMIIKRTIKAIMHINKWIMNTDSGFPPIFNITYDIGRIVNCIPPTIDWYNFTFPVADAEIINGLATASIIVMQSINLRKLVVCSGTFFNQIVSIVSVSNRIGKDKNKRRKNVNLELRNINLCMYV